MGSYANEAQHGPSTSHDWVGYVSTVNSTQYPQIWVDPTSTRVHVAQKVLEGSSSTQSKEEVVANGHHTKPIDGLPEGVGRPLTTLNDRQLAGEEEGILNAT